MENDGVLVDSLEELGLEEKIEEYVLRTPSNAENPLLTQTFVDTNLC